MRFTIGDITGLAPTRHHCEDKIRYPTSSEAAYALWSLLQKPTIRDPDKLGVYKCGDHFHIGRDKIGRQPKGGINGEAQSKEREAADEGDNGHAQTEDGDEGEETKAQQSGSGGAALAQER